LALATLRVLPGLHEGGALGALGRYLGEVAPPWDRKAYALARSVADVFDRYLLHRPDWVRAFDAGKRPRGLEDEADAAWQLAIYRALAACTEEPHFVARVDALDARTEPAAPLPERLHVFGLSALPPAYLRVLASLSRFMGVDLYLLSPSHRYWSDLRTARETSHALRTASRDAVATAVIEALERQSPILTSLGRCSRDFQLGLEDLEAGYEDYALFADPAFSAGSEARPMSLLEGLQRDVLELVSKADLDADPALGGSDALAQRDQFEGSRVVTAADDSFRVHACAGPARQVEALRDVLLGLFDDHPELEPRDVLIMTPDVETYAPLLTSLFDGDRGGSRGDDARPRIPLQVADRGLSATNATADALLRLLELASGRLVISATMDLLAIPVVRQRFDIDEAELPTLRAWASASGMRWAEDAAERAREGQPADEANTFRFGLARLALGAVADDEGELVLGALPEDAVDGEEALAGRFLAFVDAVLAHRAALRTKGTVSAFIGRLREALAALTRLGADGSSLAAEVHEALAEVETEAAGAGFDAELELDAFRRLVEGRLEGGRGGDRPIHGAVTLCALAPMRSVPFAVICLLGMDDGLFPRADRAPGFDLSTREPRVGDRDPRDEDRHLLLEALLSARRHLRLFYVGRDPRSGESRAPAVPVAELLDFVDATYRAEPPCASPRARLVVEHPLQPFSVGELVPRLPDPAAPEALRPLGFDPRMLAVAERIRAPRHASGGVFRDGALSPFEPRPVGLGELADFLRAPVRSLLRRRLGVALHGGDDGLEDREPTALDALSRWTLERALLDRTLEGLGDDLDGALDMTRVAAITRAAGVLPLGSPGELVLTRALAQAKALVEAARPHVDGPAEDLDFELELEGGTLFGTLRGVRFGTELLDLGHEPADKPRRLIAAYVSLLALQATTDRACRVRVLGPSDAGVKTSVLELDGAPGARRARARAQLGDLLALHALGLTRPLMLFEKTSMAVAKRLASRKEAADLDALFASALEAWHGSESFPGEKAERYLAFAFPGGEPPFVHGEALDEELVTLAERVYVPLLEACSGEEAPR
jgi:exodeoxyribonuclease V gamma subunit